MKVAFSGGHTTKDLYSALALVDKLAQVEKNESEHLYLSKYSKTIIETTKDFPVLKYVPIDIPEPFYIRSTIFENLVELLTWTWSYILAIFHSITALEKNRIDLVFGIGEYYAMPAFIASILTGRKLIVHSPDLIENRYIELTKLFAHKITFGFEPCEYSEDFVFTGNPLYRPDFNRNANSENIEEAEENYDREYGFEDAFINSVKDVNSSLDTVRIVIYGGYNGNQLVNDVVGESLAELNELFLELQPVMRDMNILHIVGLKEYEDHLNYYAEGLANYKFYRPIAAVKNLTKVFDCADIIVSKADAHSITEIALSGSLPVFIVNPLNETEKINASHFARHGLGYAISNIESSLDKKKERFLAIVSQLAFDRSQINEVKMKIPTEIKGSGTQNIIDLMLDIYHGRTIEAESKLGLVRILDLLP
jgi:UDP-N-acetylglucosamine:LPS N-acetylglucosamine transferase